MAKPRTPKISDDDLRLFAEAVGPVRRIAVDARTDSRQRPAPEPK